MGLTSAGILLFRRTGGSLEVFLVHPGGPFWKDKDLGAWSIPKGLIDDDEEPAAAAKREFLEETGTPVDGELIPLAPQKQKGGKTVVAWAVEGDIDPATVKSNTFRVQWPYKSGKWITVPEVDQADWFPAELGMQKINPAQAEFIRELIDILNGGSDSSDTP